MNYITRKFLEQIFGKDPLKFSSPVVGMQKDQKTRKISYNIKLPGFSPSQLASTFWRLRKKELIEYRESGGKVKIILTEAGKRKILSYQLDDLTIDKPNNWDGCWRVVAFDIPETKKKARGALVKKLKDLGLLQFQKSLWLHPYECKDQIDFVAEIFEVGKHVHYMVVQQITNDEVLRRKFCL